MSKVSLVNFYRYAKLHYKFWRKEFQSKMKVDLLTKVTMWSKGFLGESKYIYRLNKENYMYYLSDFKRLKTIYINKGYSFVLNNKIIFERTFRDSLMIPKIIALVLKGKIIAQDGEVNDIQSLVDYLRINGCVVIKPIAGGWGLGVNILRMIDGDIYCNNKIISIDNLSNKIKEMDDYFINEFIRQGDYAEKLNPATTNTIRIITMIDPESNEAFIPIAVQRIGTNRSAPADNWTRGGISAEIDVDTGTLKKGAAYPFNNKVIWHKRHPDTGAEIEGLKIPDWETIKNSILNAANKHSYIKYIGWDVVSTRNGIMVIEGNNYTDVNLLQIHRPLLKDERIKKFYKYHGII